MTFPKPPKEIYYSYHILRGEQGVLTFEPYKSHLLPLWRFRTVPIARESSAALWTRFLAFHRDGDFVGMDMARKFIQMGMTRAKRYANRKGGRKYEKAGRGDGTRGRLIEKSEWHVGKEEKEEASLVFREVWERCREHGGYRELKERFLEEQREWERVGGNRVKSEEKDMVEVQDTGKRRSKRIKTGIES